ncbi:MAG: peptidoglycan-binding protein [Alphaproteobacteria bacterium]|nr:peptidoglycan-binding protein [Alphaproteobacteria bacterium]
MPNALKILMFSTALTLIAAGAIADNNSRNSYNDSMPGTSRAIGGSDDENNTTLDRSSYSTDRNNERRDRNDYRRYPNDPERERARTSRNMYNNDSMNNRDNDRSYNDMNESERSDQRSSSSYRSRTDNGSMSNYHSGSMRSRSAQLNNAQVRDIQEGLRDQGYDVEIDGVWGPNTASALRRFQNDNNINESTNAIGSRTLNALNVDMNNRRWQDNSGY